jgi:endonuclease G
MPTAKTITAERRRIVISAYDRWKASLVDAAPRMERATAAQRERFDVREARRATFESTGYRDVRLTAERQIGATLDFVDLAPNEQALKAGRPVVRLVTLGNPGMVPEGFATGFLIGENLLLTNYHVFRDAGEARGSGAQFLYERTAAGLREGVIFELDPGQFFVNDRALDYAVVAVKRQALNGAPLSEFQFLPLIGATGKILTGDAVNIIQYPAGGPKQYAVVNNHLLDLREDGFLLYETDTLEGSSGSPVFNQHWETIGLHHCGVPQMEDGMLVTRDGRRVAPDAEVADSDLVWIANEGIRVSAIVASLSAQRLDDVAKQEILAGLLAATSDPLELVPASVVRGSSTSAPSVTVTDTVTESAAMPSTIFQFTGPVTIVLNPAPAAPTVAPALAAATLQLASPALAPASSISSEPGFREKTLKFDEEYTDRPGYQTDFLDGWEVPAPTLTSGHVGETLKDADGDPLVIPYHHYSLVMNRERRLLSWAASNVDYSTEARSHTKTRKEYGGENWRLDPRVALVAPGLQIEDADFYAPAKKIDRGHIVRREDGAWGATAKEAEYGNSDTYHWTNCTPQSEAFNQSGKSGVWGQFEEHIQGEVDAVGGRMTVFAGPVLSADDPEHGYDDTTPIQVPMQFWKVVVCTTREAGRLERLAYAFVFDQTEPVKRLGYEKMNMEDYEIYQVPLLTITQRTGVAFHSSLLQADVLKDARRNESIRAGAGRRIRSLGDVTVRMDAPRDSGPINALLATLTPVKATRKGK